MMVCPHASFSQRATWPPRAAVRQPSIALITFNCAWLRWPRLARRQARPWSRKISATSRAGRDTGAAGYAGVPFPGLRGLSRSSGLTMSRNTLLATCA